MDRIFQYYSSKEAEEIRHTYSSWIGKKAYTGRGKQAVLSRIIVRRADELFGKTPGTDNYFVEFEFENREIFNSYEFMTSNGLSPAISINTEGNASHKGEKSPDTGRSRK
ncbi:MAG: hypothetical protein ACXVP0_14390 [Bacteroidia bacterium]